MPFPWLAVASMVVPPVLNTLGNLFGADQQQGQNMELAKYQNEYNMRMLRNQRRYDLPINQRKRLEAAGLNPAIMYGQGGSVTQSRSQAMPSADIKAADYQAAFANIGTQLAQSRLMSSQADLIEQKTDESGIKQDLMQAQKNLVNANPYLNDAYVNAIVTNLQSVAAIKKQEADFLVNPAGYSGVSTPGIQKMQLEIENLVKRFELSEKDLEVKAKIIQSKEFQNAILKVQKEWLTNAEITPQHVYQGILMLLSKMM